MRALAMLVFLGVPWAACADEALWARIKAEPNIVVLTRNMQSAGGTPRLWDETGGCQGEARLTPKGRADARKLGELFSARSISPFVMSSPLCRCRETATIAFGEALMDPGLREVATADTAGLRAFDQKATSLLLKHRGGTPIVFVSHRPNIEFLALEIIDEGDLLVGKVSDSGEVQVLGKMKLPRAGPDRP
jgi:phosphohistidine phosphatase SixA